MRKILPYLLTSMMGLASVAPAMADGGLVRTSSGVLDPSKAVSVKAELLPSLPRTEIGKVSRNSSCSSLTRSAVMKAPGAVKLASAYHGSFPLTQVSMWGGGETPAGVNLDLSLTIDSESGTATLTGHAMDIKALDTSVEYTLDGVTLTLNSAVVGDGQYGTKSTDIAFTVENDGSLSGDNQYFCSNSTTATYRFDLSDSKMLPEETEEPESQWQSLGMAQYTDGIASGPYSIDILTYEVEVEQSLDNPSLYRLVNPYTNGNWEYNSDGSLTIDSEKTSYLTFDVSDPSKVVIVTTESDGSWNYSPLNVDLGGYGELQVFDLSFSGGYGTFAGGNIIFPAKSLLVSETDDEDMYYSKEVKVVLPGAADYSLQLSSDELCVEGAPFPFNITVGADVPAVKWLFISGQYGASADNFAVVAQSGSNLNAESASYQLTPQEAGWYTLFAVALDAEGNVLNGSAIFCYNEKHEADEWTSLGSTEFIDDTFLPIFGINDQVPPMEVEILENKATPGLYRLVDAYAAHPALTADMLHSGHHHYLDIDATDPAAVKIAETPMGIDFDGHFTLKSNNDGTLAGGAITFPSRGLVLYIGDSGYYANQAGNFKVSIPYTVTVTVTDGDGPIEGAYVGVDGSEDDDLVTDAEGKVTLISSKHAGTELKLSAQKDEYQGEGVTVTLGDDVKLSATIVLEKAVDTALFQVVTTDQKPIEGATITVEGIETPQVTDASGYVWFTLPIEYFSGKETHYAVTKEGYVKCTGTYKFTEAMVACVVVLEVDPGSGIVGVESADAGAAVRFFDLSGRVANGSTKGLVIGSDGTKTLIRK